MGSFRFDWRWVAAIVFIAIMVNGRVLPWPVTALTLGGSGAYLLYMAWQSWGLGGSVRSRDTRRVTYWRGQRIETANAPRRSRPLVWSELAPVLVYALVGLALLLAAVLVVMNRAGI